MMFSEAVLSSHGCACNFPSLGVELCCSSWQHAKDLDTDNGLAQPVFPEPSTFNQFDDS